MTGSALQEYTRGILTHVPWEHWVVMVVVSLALTVILLIRKKCSVYGAIALGFAVFIGLVLLDTAVLIRHLGLLLNGTGRNLGFTLDRLLHGSEVARSEVISNLIVFIPFGFFLAEYLASLKRLSFVHRLGLVTLTAFSLSLFIECLQLVLKVGYFEVMDMVLNTVGGIVGTGVSLLLRRFLRSRVFERNDDTSQQPPFPTND